MSGGYAATAPPAKKSDENSSDPSNQQLAVLSANTEACTVPHPACAHQSLRLHFGVINSFALRAKHFYAALQGIATYLPDEGEKALEAMHLVTIQRKWMYDVSCAVGSVVGTFYQLEKNTLSELEVMWRTGERDMTIKSMKKNFRATVKNLSMLADYRKEAEETIKDCEKHANQMVKWGHGDEQKLQHAAMELVGKFGGSAQCRALLDDLAQCNQSLKEAQKQEQDAVEKVADLKGNQQDLLCKNLVYESIAANEKGSLQELQSRARVLDDEAAEKAKQASETFNIAHKKRTLFGLGSWYTDWIDNKGDVARWRADRFKAIAKEAKEQEGDQQQRAKKAATDAAAIKRELAQVNQGLEHAQKTLEHAARKVAEARAELNQKRAKAQELRHQFGNLDLHHIASLRDHMQAFPELLGAQGNEDQSMFASMKGALKQHQRLCDRMQEFLDEDDDRECQFLLDSLKPTILQAIEDSHFFSDTMAVLKDSVDNNTKGIKDKSPPKITLLPIDASSQPMPEKSKDSDEGFTLVNLSTEDDDDLW